VSEPVTSSKLDRRALLLGAVFLLGGAAALTRFTRKSDGHAGAAGPELSGDQFMLLEQVADTMIPGTDTPGALAAGVPLFVRDMLADWASAGTRTEILTVLEAIERQAWAQFGAAFLELSADRRLAALRRFDEDALARQDPAYAK
jgi:gluconate 2-dehydrogenase gamma chain